MNVRLHSFAGRFVIGGAAAVTCCFTGCGEHSQDLDERVTQLQKELDRTQTELQAANQSLKAAKDELARRKSEPTRSEPPHPGTKASAAGAPALPSRDAFEKSYTAKAKVLKQELQGKLQQFSVDTCTLYHVQMPSPEFPVTSKISLSVRSSAGNSFQLDVPAKADRVGNWFFPDVAEITQRIEELGRSTAAARPASTQASRPSAGAVAPEPARRGTGPRADKTVVIQWPGSNPTSPQQSQPSTPSVPAPSTGTVPRSGGGGTQGMAADKTVVIQWPDSSGSSAAANPPNAPGRAPNPPPPPAQTQSPADRSVLTQF
jgi:outer membrane murein-binding lipoprotein Lpp